MSKVEWKDIDNYASDCESILKVNNLTVLRIMSGRTYFYCMYSNPIFKTPTLSYSTAADLARAKLKEDSLENRLTVAKDFFLKDLKRQIDETTAYFNTIIDIEDEEDLE